MIFSFKFSKSFALLRKGQSEAASCSRQIEIVSLSVFEAHFFVEIVGIIIDMADVDYDKELVKILPQHEECPIIFVLVAKIKLVFSGNPLPEVGVTIASSSLPLNVPPWVSYLQHWER